MTGGPLGPFETRGDALLAVRPGDGSFISRESRSGLLTQTLRAAGVNLGGWDQVVLGWLASQDVQTVAAVAGWVARSAPPRVVFTAGQEAVIAQALADAETYRRKRAGTWCGDCAAGPAGGCDDHLDDLDQADAYRDLAAGLAGGAW
jgi:hypothetical protein